MGVYCGPALYSVDLNVKVNLLGGYIPATSLMKTTLRTRAWFPKSQPYNKFPWYYNGVEKVSSVPVNVCDWILVELRSNLYDTVYRKVGFLMNNSTILDIDGVNPLKIECKFPLWNYFDDQDEFHIVIRHRNHLDIMSSTTKKFTDLNTQYDFTSSSGMSYGTDSMLVSSDGKWSMIVGDVDNNGVVDPTTGVTSDDTLMITYCGIRTLFEYSNFDINMDGIARANGSATVNDEVILRNLLGTTIYTCKVP
jgi:hypothetical protein